MLIFNWKLINLYESVEIDGKTLNQVMSYTVTHTHRRSRDSEYVYLLFHFGLDGRYVHETVDEWRQQREGNWRKIRLAYALRASVALSSTQSQRA